MWYWFGVLSVVRVDVVVYPFSQWEGVYLLRNPDNTLPNVTGWTWQLQLRKDPLQAVADLSVVPTPYTEPGQTVPSGAFVVLTATQTAALFGAGLPERYSYWLEATIGGTAYLAAEGTARIDPGGVR